MNHNRNKLRDDAKKLREESRKITSEIKLAHRRVKKCLPKTADQTARENGIVMERTLGPKADELWRLADKLETRAENTQDWATPEEVQAEMPFLAAMDGRLI